MVSAAHSDSIRTVHEWVHDSVLIRDSIFIHQKGDTVWCNRWHEHTAYKYLNRTDTLYRDREKTITLPPERYIPPFYRWCTTILLTAIGAMMMVAVVMLLIRRHG